MAFSEIFEFYLDELQINFKYRFARPINAEIVGYGLW